MMGVVRHLSEHQALMALRRGASIEQMLTESLSQRALRWCSARRSGARFALTLHHVHDDGDDDFLDVYEFETVDDKEEVGEGRLVGEYSDAASVLKAAGAIGARADRWVNAGVIQDEYASLRQAKP
jgi:hypothetical protein